MQLVLSVSLLASFQNINTLAEGYGYMITEMATHKFAKDEDDVDVGDRQKLLPDVEDGLQQRNSLSVSEKRIVLFKSL